MKNLLCVLCTLAMLSVNFSAVILLGCSTTTVDSTQKSIDNKSPDDSLITLPDAQAGKIQQLITQLDDDDWQTREKATKELIAMGESVMPHLEKVTTNDSEVKTGIDRVLWYFAKQKCEEFLKQEINRLQKTEDKDAINYKYSIKGSHDLLQNYRFYRLYENFLSDSFIQPPPQWYRIYALRRDGSILDIGTMDMFNRSGNEHYIKNFLNILSSENIVVNNQQDAENIIRIWYAIYNDLNINPPQFNFNTTKEGNYWIVTDVNLPPLDNPRWTIEIGQDSKIKYITGKWITK